MFLHYLNYRLNKIVFSLDFSFHSERTSILFIMKSLYRHVATCEFKYHLTYLQFCQDDSG